MSGNWYRQSSLMLLSMKAALALLGLAITLSLSSGTNAEELRRPPPCDRANFMKNGVWWTRCVTNYDCKNSIVPRKCFGKTGTHLEYNYDMANGNGEKWKCKCLRYTD